MPVKPIPDGYHTVTPVLTIHGAAKVIEFVKQAFDAKEVYRLPGPDGAVMHAEVKIGDSMVMLGEATDEWKPMPATVALYVEDTDAWYKRALRAGATSVREPSDQFYGDRSTGVKALGRTRDVFIAAGAPTANAMGGRSRCNIAAVARARRSRPHG